ncbi:hypothetical protein IWX50DRAFT_490038 [Phyllosticta citricarpa]
MLSWWTREAARAFLFRDGGAAVGVAGWLTGWLVDGVGWVPPWRAGMLLPPLLPCLVAWMVWCGEPSSSLSPGNSRRHDFPCTRHPPQASMYPVRLGDILVVSQSVSRFWFSGICIRSGGARLLGNKRRRCLVCFNRRRLPPISPPYPFSPYIDFSFSYFPFAMGGDWFGLFNYSAAAV